MNVSHHRRAQQAFSLIELLLVLVILAVLAAVIVPKFSGRSQQARETAAQADISALELSLDVFETDIGRYPTRTEGLDALVREPAGLPDGVWKGYLKRGGVPTDPWGSEYVYVQPGQHNTDSYDLYSPGPDRQEGTDDDIVNWTVRE